MKNIASILFTCLWAFLLLLVPCAYSDTILLKNGGSIETDKYWEENGILKCTKYGGIVEIPVADVLRIIADKKGQSGPENGFGFDIWRFGMGVEEVMNRAERNDLPLRRAGLISAGKHFNPAHCRKYMHTSNAFDYSTSLLGKPATIQLCLTPLSRQLYEIKIHFGGPDINRKSGFHREVESMLRRKYGRSRIPINLNGKALFYDTVLWVVQDRYDVVMETGFGSINIVYSDRGLSKKAKEESAQIKAEKREKYHRADEPKF